MRAVVLTDGDLVVEDVPDPVPGPGEVLVRTLACGICGSDLHARHHLADIAAIQSRTAGDAALDPARPVVMGHEFCAEVVDHGPETRRTQAPGTRVCSVPAVPRPGGVSAVGYDHTYPGGYGELMLLSERLLLPVPDELGTDLAALTEPLSVGRHAVVRAELQADDVPLVVGCGPVGLAVLAELRRRGVGPILAADFSPARRRLAEALGADEVIDPASSSPYRRWKELCYGDGPRREGDGVFLLGSMPKRPAVVFECVGVPGVLNAIFADAVRDARVVVVGVCMQADTFEPLHAFNRELTVRFSLGYTAPEFGSTLEDLGAGLLDVADMVTGHVSLDDTPAAFDELANPNAHAKILVEPTR